MPKPAAKKGDSVSAIDVHFEIVSGQPVLVPNKYEGSLTSGLSPDVLVENKWAATIGSGSEQRPPHAPQQGPFVKEPTNKGVVISGEATVLINNKPAARSTDVVKTCCDPVDLPVGTISAESTVLIVG